MMRSSSEIIIMVGLESSDLLNDSNIRCNGRADEVEAGVAVIET